MGTQECPRYLTALLGAQVTFPVLVSPGKGRQGCTNLPPPGGARTTSFLPTPLTCPASAVGGEGFHGLAVLIRGSCSVSVTCQVLLQMDN